MSSKEESFLCSIEFEAYPCMSMMRGTVTLGSRFSGTWTCQHLVRLSWSMQLNIPSSVYGGISSTTNPSSFPDSPLPPIRQPDRLAERNRTATRARVAMLLQARPLQKSIVGRVEDEQF